MSRFGYHLPILAYHRVGPCRSDHVPTVSPESFERQLAFLGRRRYRVMSLEEIADELDRGRPLPRRSVAITFDDGYEETHAVAWPLLKRFGFPSAVFLATAEVGSKGFVSWPQIAEMARQGMTIGSHTTHHSYLPVVPSERLPLELAESKRVIEERLGRPIHFLSYPVGGFTEEVQHIARQAGYRAACTTNRLSPSGAADRFALRRIKVTERDGNLLLFRAKVSGYYDAFRQLKQAS